MSQRMQGMDTEHGRTTGQAMGAQAAQVGGVLSSIGAMIAGLDWQGSDRTAFEGDWSGSFEPQARNAAQTLEEQGRALCQHADAQDRASS